MTKIVWTRFPITYITRPNSNITTMKYPTPVKTGSGRSRTANEMGYRAARYREANRACCNTFMRLVKVSRISQKRHRMRKRKIVTKIECEERKKSVGIVVSLSHSCNMYVALYLDVTPTRIAQVIKLRASRPQPLRKGRRERCVACSPFPLANHR